MKLKVRSKIIAGIQVAGSAFALVTALVGTAAISDNPDVEINALALLAYLVVLALSIAALVFGILFWTGKRIGYLGSVAIHALQVPFFVTQAMTYKVAFGIGIFLNVIGPEKLVDLRFGGTAVVWLFSEPIPFVFSVNLYALFALMYLVRDSMLSETLRQTAPKP